MLQTFPYFSRILFAGMITGLIVAAHAASAEDAKKAISAKACFDQLKKLEGKWVGNFTHGEEPAGETTIRYTLSGGGSALVEHLFEGSDHEMITVYHLDGDRLLMTHYCALQNQPRMCAKLGDDPNTIAFKFLDGTNMDAKKDMHMHEATIRFVDDDHVMSEWTSYIEGKPSSTAKFDLKRKDGR